jgi:hypothetical protein
VFDHVIEMVEILVTPVFDHIISFRDRCHPCVLRFSSFSKFLCPFVPTLQVDEPEDLTGIDNLMKDIITCDVYQFEEKGLQPYSLPVYPNFILTDNNGAPVKIEDGERRWVAFMCNNVHKDKHHYFHELHLRIASPEGLRSIYQGLMSHDIKHIYNMQSVRVLTDYYMKCRSLFLTPLAKFFSALYKRALQNKEKFASPADTDSVECSGSFPAEKLRLEFVSFLDNTKLENSQGWNQRVFGNKMGEHVEHFKRRAGETFNKEATGSGICKSEGANGNVYEVDFIKLKGYLDRKKYFDEDAEFTDPVLLCDSGVQSHSGGQPLPSRGQPPSGRQRSSRRQPYSP